VTPHSWEHWITHYQRIGYEVVAPAYPGFEVEAEVLNADPSPIENVTALEIIAHLVSVVGALDGRCCVLRARSGPGGGHTKPGRLAVGART
jgi:hypothetical protein